MTYSPESMHRSKALFWFNVVMYQPIFPKYFRITPLSLGNHAIAPVQMT